jgi:hypothetical protein
VRVVSLSGAGIISTQATNDQIPDDFSSDASEPLEKFETVDMGGCPELISLSHDETM